jgi:hypothetical protein
MPASTGPTAQAVPPPSTRAQIVPAQQVPAPVAQGSPARAQGETGAVAPIGKQLVRPGSPPQIPSQQSS